MWPNLFLKSEVNVRHALPSHKYSSTCVCSGVRVAAARTSRVCYRRTSQSSLWNTRHKLCRQQVQRVKAGSNPSLDDGPGPSLVGEDAAAFDVQQQNVKSWSFFVVELAAVLAIMYQVWMAPGSGLAYNYIGWLDSWCPNSEANITAQLLIFAATHSGGAFLRPYGENLLGARTYRVIFAALSLPLATTAVFFFINHRYDGMPLWNLRGQPFVHEAVWILNFISFFFLYPSTFNLLEVAAIDKPKVHMWETGVMRITRHPQAVGQLLWCLGHLLWVGSSFMVTTSAVLCAHHAFGVWHGDFRLARKYGEAFEEVKSRTSVVPFQAIVDGRQQLPDDYYKEWLRLPYITIALVSVGCYLVHPLMQQAAYFFDW